VITAEETFPNLLRAAATIARVTHGPGCPDFAAHRRAAELLDRVAAAEESGTDLRVGERDAALQAARAYLRADATAEVPA
jgi:hypothetical protein